jgi:hypothetical protein
MSVYKALIDFRDNDNDPMWVKNEDKWSILKIATVSKRDRGKSILELYFTEEEFLQIFIDDNDHTNNSFLIRAALGGNYYGYLFVDEYYESESTWLEGYIFNYFNDENKKLVKEILKLSRPSLMDIDLDGPDADEVGKFFYSFFSDEAGDIGSNYASEYDSALVKGLKDYILKHVCNPFKMFNLIEKSCAEKYYTTVNNFLKVWNLSDSDEQDDVMEMLKNLASKYDLGIEGDLYEDYHSYWDSSYFDEVSFNRNTNTVLERLKDKLIDEFDEFSLKENTKILDKLSNYGYKFDKRYSFPKEKNFGEKSNLTFEFKEVSDGEVKIMLYDGIKTTYGWYDYEELINFLFHPELF